MVFRDQNIFWLEISMNYIVLMQVVKALSDLNQNLGNGFLVNALTIAE